MPSPGPIELELIEVTGCHHHDPDYRDSDRQDALWGLLHVAITSQLYLTDKISPQAIGWIVAASNANLVGNKLPEPDKSEWLSWTMQGVLGFATLKEFMAADFGRIDFVAEK
jgi:hypothetical protein